MTSRRSNNKKKPKQQQQRRHDEGDRNENEEGEYVVEESSSSDKEGSDSESYTNYNDNDVHENGEETSEKNLRDEDVDPPDELDIASLGSSMQEILVGRTSHIALKRLMMGLQFIKKWCIKGKDAVVNQFKSEDGRIKFATKEEMAEFGRKSLNAIFVFEYHQASYKIRLTTMN